MSERALHWQLADFLRLALPPLIAWTTVRNEGRRGWQEQQDLKRKGMRKGWPDMHFVGRHLRTGECVSLHLELKRPGEEPDEDQRGIIEWLNRCGATAAWADTLEGALAEIDRAFGSDLLARLVASGAPNGSLRRPAARSSPTGAGGADARATPRHHARKRGAIPERMTAAQYRQLLAAPIGNRRRNRRS